jgi:hypothetical protein
MSTQQASGVGGTPAPSLPDLNVGRYPFEEVQRLVDRAAWINMYAIPDATRSGGASGFECTATLHRFGIETPLPDADSCIKAVDTVGQSVGRLDLRWSVIPFDFAAVQGASTPATALDRSRSQRIVIQEGTFRFGDGRDGFRSFGTGRTFPKEVGGRQQLVAAAIGNITEGFGRFAGLEGNYIVAGQVREDGALVGDIMARMVDPDGTLRARDPLPPIQRTADSEPGVAYFTMSSRKSGPDMLTTYNIGPDGKPRGLNVPQQLLHARTDFMTLGNAGFGSEIETGPVIGRVISLIHTAEGGTGSADAPLMFQGAGHFRFTDRKGRVIGGYTGQSLEGRNFAMQLAGAPGQQAFRYGYFGPILHGEGCFAGAEGMFFGCAGVGISPHVLSNVFILRLHDPDGRFRGTSYP